MKLTGGVQFAGPGYALQQLLTADRTGSDHVVIDHACLVNKPGFVAACLWLLPLGVCSLPVLWTSLCSICDAVLQT